MSLGENLLRFRVSSREQAAASLYTGTQAAIKSSKITCVYGNTNDLSYDKEASSF